MRVAFVFLFLVLVTIGSFFVVYEESKKPAKHQKLHDLQEKFLKIDIDDKNLDLNKSIQDIKEARKLYPLDNTLKMIDIELEHKRANQSF